MKGTKLRLDCKGSKLLKYYSDKERQGNISEPFPEWKESWRFSDAIFIKKKSQAPKNIQFNLQAAARVPMLISCTLNDIYFFLFPSDSPINFRLSA